MTARYAGQRERGLNIWSGHTLCWSLLSRPSRATACTLVERTTLAGGIARSAASEAPYPQPIIESERLIVDSEDNKTVEENEIIQIAPPHKWGGCLAVVSEKKSFGVQCYVSIPHNDGTPPADAYIRINWDEFERVGARAIFIPASHDTE
jgi:hypothetical protein